MIWRLECAMTAPVSITQAFAVFEDPHNLAKITPPWLRFRIATQNRIAMREGAEIDYTIRWLGLPFDWKTLITEYTPPYSFLDQQIRGPYRLWRHRHTFRETPSGTMISDRVDYRLPFGLVGDVAHELIVKRQLTSIFRFRQEAIRSFFTPDARVHFTTHGPRTTPVTEQA